jgi:hypothetical protein
VRRIGMDERDLEPEQPSMGLEVDQLHALVRETLQLSLEVGDLVGNVMHARAAFGDEPAHVRVFAERAQELDATVAYADCGGLDALVGHRLALLQLGPEDAPVRVEGLVEIDDRHAKMMDPLRLHREEDAND